MFQLPLEHLSAPVGVAACVQKNVQRAPSNAMLLQSTAALLCERGG